MVTSVADLDLDDPFADAIAVKRAPFLTGSRRYGTPSERSDCDIVCLLDDNELINSMVRLWGSIFFTSDGHRSIRSGDLNLIIVPTAELYDAWKRGTEHLASIAPVTREQAIAHFNSIGVTGQVSNRTA